MINENLKEYMEYITIKNDKLAEYKNYDKGLCYPITLSQLLVRVDLLELEEEQLKKLIFEEKLEDKDYKFYDKEIKVPKSEITGEEKDTFTITTKKIKTTRIYNVANQIGIHYSTEDKKEAFELLEEINKIIYESLR